MIKANEKSAVFTRCYDALIDAQCVGRDRINRMLFDDALETAATIAERCATGEEASAAIHALYLQPWQVVETVQIVCGSDEPHETGKLISAKPISIPGTIK
jgi:hypothetical protein